MNMSSEEKNHPKDFDECVKGDVYERDLAELKKDIENMHESQKSKKAELQKEIEYKSSNNQKLTVYTGTASIGISAYLFTQIESIRAVVTEHNKLLWHDGAYEMIKILQNDVTPLMCKVFGVCS